MAMICSACGTEAAEGARFCRRCGKPLAASPPPELDLDVTVVMPRAKPKEAKPAARSPIALVALGALAATAVIVAGGVIWYQQEKAALQAESVRLAELQMQAQVRAVRKRAEEAEQARIDAEQQAAHALAQQENARREAEAARTEVRTAAARAAREAQLLARRQAAERAQQEAVEKRRAEEIAAASVQTRAAMAAAAASAARAAAAAQAAASQKPETQAVAASPEALCRAQANFILRGFCEARECIKPQYIDSPYCRSLRARSNPVPQ